VRPLALAPRAQGTPPARPHDLLARGPGRATRTRGCHPYVGAHSFIDAYLNGGGGTEYKVRQVAAHPGFALGAGSILSGDVAVLFLERRARVSESVSVTRIAPQSGAPAWQSGPRLRRSRGHVSPAPIAALEHTSTQCRRLHPTRAPPSWPPPLPEFDAATAAGNLWLTAGWGTTELNNTGHLDGSGFGGDTKQVLQYASAKFIPNSDERCSALVGTCATQMLW
jgi:hypothetical protein